MRVFFRRCLIATATCLTTLGIVARAQDVKTAQRTVTVIRNGVKNTQSQAVQYLSAKPGALSSAAGSPLARTAPALTRAKSLTLAIPAASSVHSAAASNGNPAAVDLGSVTVGAAPATQTITYTPPDSSATLTLSLFAALDFSIQSGSCTSNQCSVVIAFKPLYPGRLNDSITIKDANGNVYYQTFLSGTGVAGQFGYELGTAYIYGGPAAAPAGIAIGPDEAYYIGDPGGQTVYKVSNDVGTVTNLAIQVGLPSGIAVDGEGTVYVGDRSTDTIIKFTAAGVQSVVTTSGLSNPTGLAVDGTGALYIVDTNHNRVIKIDNQGNETTVASELNSPQGDAVDTAGNLYVDDGGNGGQILKFPVTGGAPVILAQNQGTVQGVAVDASGRIYYTTSTGEGVLSPNYGVSTFYCNSTCTDGPYGIAVDQNGDVVTTQAQDAKFIITHRSTSNFILSTTPGQTSMGTLTASNTGNANLTLSGLNVSGPTFTLDPSTTCSATGTLTSGQVCNVTVDFTPPAAQTYNETLTINSNSLNVTTSDIFYLYGQGQSIPSTTTLTISNTAPAFGQSITFTAQVVSGAPTTGGVSGPSRQIVAADATQPAPTGTVTFFDGSTALGSGTISSATGVATYSTSSLSSGAHNISATYNADNLYAASTSAVQVVTVSAATTVPTPTVVLTNSTAPVSIVYGRFIQYLADVFVGTQRLTSGQVILCNAAAPTCTPELSIATAQLNPVGDAGFPVVYPTIGTHTYKAVFLGTTAYAKATSSIATVVVTGTYPDSTVLTSTGTPGAYSLTAAVAGKGPLAPTGLISFNDTTANSTLGTATLGAGTSSFSATEATGSPYKVGTNPYAVVTGDFNGDGRQDVVFANYNSGSSQGSISVLIGNGDGTFKTPVSYPVGAEPERILAADFNGDGYLDLVVANTGNPNIGVLLGNGDGTFKPQITYAATSPVGLGVMDINHDGFADIVAGNFYENTLSVLLGNGDGTFKAAVNYPTGANPQTLAEGDFNGDGNVDVVVGYRGSPNVGVFLGKGDGTFATAVTYPVGLQPQGVQVGDFNGDGKDDLAVVNSGSNTVSILIGNGDGTFQPQATYPVGSNPVGLVIADFNADGKQDISVGNTAQNALTQSILLGNGDGTFQPQYTFATGNFPYNAAAADFNGDGFADLAISTFTDGNAQIFLSQVTDTASATLANVSLATAGTHLVNASYPGDTNFAASTSNTVPLVSTALAPSITTVTTTTPTQSALQYLVLAISVAGTSQTTPLPTGTYSFTTVSGPGPFFTGSYKLGSGSSQFGGAGLTPGNYTIVANYSGDSVYAPSVSAPLNLIVTAVTSATTLATSAATITANQTETLTATIPSAPAAPAPFGSGPGYGPIAPTGTITFADQNGTLGTMTLTGATTSSSAALSLTTLSAGVHQIVAKYSGDKFYTASTSPTQTVTVGSGTTTTTLGVSAAAITFGQTETLTANIAGGTSPAETGTVTFSDQTGTLGTVTVTPTATGSTARLVLTNLSVLTHQIVAKYSGDTNYAASTSAAQAVAVTLTANTITFPAIPNHTVGDAPFTVSATASSGLPVTFAVTSGPATISGSTVTLTGPGTVVITASQAGNTTYAAATPVSQSFTVSYLAPTLTSVSPATGALGSAATPITLTGTNFVSTDLVLLNGTAIASTYVSPTSITATLPASFFTVIGTGVLTVRDSASNLSTGGVNFTVSVAPSIVFTGPSSSTSGTQPTLTFTLVNPYPVVLTGTITLTFTPASSTLTNDPNVVFANGTRTITYTIPANSTTTPAIQLQTGTVAGTANINLAVSANGVPITLPSVAPVVITIPAAVPTVTTASLARSGNTLTVTVVGFSNTREAQQAAFHFNPIPGGSLNNPDITVPVTTDFSTWYTQAASQTYGSAFTYTQVFTLDQDASVIQNVTVTLTNSIGQSITATTP